MKLYKYRTFPETTDAHKLGCDESILGLFEGVAWASSRKYFNDPFDSHINYTAPTAAELKALAYKLSGKEKRQIKAWVSNGRLTDEFFKFWPKIVVGFDDIVDSYPVYCFASEPDNNILWSHYACNHTGFCIELEHPDFEYTRVSYRKKLPEIAGIDLIKAALNIDAERIGKLIYNGLHTKMDYWQVENELRHIAKGRLPPGQKGQRIPFPENSITAIIFGHNTNPAHQDYIINNLPYKTNFKKARVEKHLSKIVIEELNER